MSKTIHRFPRVLLDRQWLFGVLAERKKTRASASKVGRALEVAVQHPLQSARAIMREAAPGADGRYTPAEKRLCTAFVREWEKYGPATYVPSPDEDVEAAMGLIAGFAEGVLAKDGRRKPTGGPAPKLTEGEVAEIQARWAHRESESGLTKGDLAEEYDVSLSLVEKVLSGKYAGRPDEEV